MNSMAPQNVVSCTCAYAAPKSAASIRVVCLQASLRTDLFISDKRPIILFDGVCNM